MKEVSAGILQGKYEEVLASVQSPVISLTELIKNSSDSCRNRDNEIVIDIDSVNNIITITDFGEGLCEHDILVLGQAGFSDKMIGTNIQSPIGNTLSGSKGLGLLTAFFIANTLEIDTYSSKDNKSYNIVWEKGNQKYMYDVSSSTYNGTTIRLKNVDAEKLQMILLPEEKVKLFMSSIAFYNKDLNLPRLRLYVDGIEEQYSPEISIDDFYQLNKKSDSGFVAKASFKYKDNLVYLSYEDNISSYYNFENKCINLLDKSSIEDFVHEIKAPEKGVAPIKNISDLKAFSDLFKNVELPEFSGIFYTWRGKKENKLDPWPPGVRIYINKYSLYKYLDKENDWITLSEISQNLKATNYKLKNTYGFLEINNYNENHESLKISKERNDFVDSLAQRKFICIMRDIISQVFARIDIATKNPPFKSFSLKATSIEQHIGEPYNLKNLIVLSNIDLNELKIEYDKSQITFDENWIICSNKKTTTQVKIQYAEQIAVITLKYKEKIPKFDLTRSNVTIYKGNTVNLKDYICNCIDTNADEIIIRSENIHTHLTDELFDKDNPEGVHTIIYKKENFQKILTVTVKEIIGQPGAGSNSPRIEALFPRMQDLKEQSYKIPELIEGISSNYRSYPTLCMATIRILLESSVKAFLLLLIKEEMDNDVKGLVNKVINIRNCNEGNPDYVKIASYFSDDYKSKFVKVSEEYSLLLTKDVKTNINNHLNNIDLNSFVHNPDIIATDITVYNTMKIFSPLLNYIFDVLLIEHQ